MCKGSTIYLAIFDDREDGSITARPLCRFIDAMLIIAEWQQNCGSGWEEVEVDGWEYYAKDGSGDKGSNMRIEKVVIQ